MRSRVRWGDLGEVTREMWGMTGIWLRRHGICAPPQEHSMEASTRIV